MPNPTVVQYGFYGTGGAHFGPQPDGEFVKLAELPDYSALQSEVEALRKDAERLDWLDRMNAALNERNGTTYNWRLILSPNIVRLMAGIHHNGYVGDIDLNDANSGRESHRSVRAAIDAALAQKGE